MLLHAPSTPGELKLLSPIDSSLRPPDLPFFRPLPPLPSASTLQLPSFLNFSSQSLDSSADTPPHSSATSLPGSALFSSSHHVVVRRTKNTVFEGPHWIPAFHHPNSPYVPWSSPVRRRILPLPSSPSISSPHIRSGAVAPEPWASSAFSQDHDESRRERLSRSWKSLKNSVKKGVKTVMSHLGKSTKSLRTICTGQDMLRAYDDDTALVQPHLPSDAVRATLANGHSRCSRDSLASFVSSDSRTLAAWLAERRTSAPCISDNSPVEMSMEDYELMGSWLDLRHCNGGWLCGIPDCGMHTVGGSPCLANEHPNALRMAMPFDSADLLSAMHKSPKVSAWPFPVGPFSVAPRFFSLPQLPCQSFDIHSAQKAAPCLARCRELSMPGGWTF